MKLNKEKHVDKPVKQLWVFISFFLAAFVNFALNGNS